MTDHEEQSDSPPPADIMLRQTLQQFAKAAAAGDQGGCRTCGCLDWRAVTIGERSYRVCRNCGAKRGPV